MRTARRAFAGLLITVATLASGARASSYLEWTVEDIESTLTSAYARSTIAIDHLGAPHVAYFVGGANDVRYATRVDGAWLVEVVEDSTAIDSLNGTAMPCLALDSQSRPHALYWASRDGAQVLVYASRDASGWRREIVDNSPGGSMDGRLALDPLDNPHIAYSRSEGAVTVLHYRVRDSEGWSDNAVGDGDQPALALDGAGGPVIVFRSCATATWMRLQHAVPAGAGWALTDMGLQGSWPDLALDDAGRVHATAKIGSWVYYFTNGTGAWSFASIVQTFTDARDAPIAIDRRQEPVIVCCDTSRDVRWVHRRGGAWQVEWVDPDGGTLWGVTPSLALDAAGQPRVVSCSRPTLRLSVATDTVIDWCDLQGPAAVVAAAGVASVPLYGQVRIDGLTDQPGATPGVMAQVGYGRAGNDPTADPDAWQWAAAAFSADVGDNDEYAGTLTVAAAGNYSFCYRYRYAAGPWIYADLDGSTNGYWPEQAGTLTVYADAPTIGWCNLQWPPMLSVTAGEPGGPVFGQVWISGVTDQSGEATGLVAELGYGPDGSDPSVNPTGWRWTPAVYGLDAGDNDEYGAVMTVPLSGTFDYAFRYAFDGGEWVYGDLNGSIGGYSPARAGDLTVGGQTGVPGTMPAQLRLYPNPFNPRTTIRFDLPVAGNARLAIYDVAGRLVKVLVDGDVPAGSHATVWDGKGAAGRGMPSGSYFARLSADGRVETVRMGLVR